MTESESCIIIGAGISGLLAAQRLMRYDMDVTIIEKGRSVGGRMAVKHIGDAVFDAGAQFVTTRDMIFRERVEFWLSKGEVKPWYPGPLKNMRYVGVDGMNKVPKRIGESLHTRLSEKAIKLKFAKKKWTVTTRPHGEKSTNTYTADWLVMTAPVPQNMELLEASKILLDYDDEEELKKIQYIPCMTVLAQLNGPSGLPNPGAMDLNHEVLRWIGDNHMKGISPNPGSITLHCSPKFTAENWDLPSEELIQKVMTAAKPYLKADLVEAITHRWRYSDPVRIYREKHPFRKPYFIDEDLQLGMAGDGFNGARLEAAGLSGMELASAIISPV